MTPADARTDPPETADELTTLRAYLDYQRGTFRRKATGLSRSQLATPHPPSTLTLAGLTKHLALQEDWWLGVVLTGRAPMPPSDAVDFDRSLVAEGVGFEPTRSELLAVFKTAAIGH
jgi:hypothetical protein